MQAPWRSAGGTHLLNEGWQATRAREDLARQLCADLGIAKRGTDLLRCLSRGESLQGGTLRAGQAAQVCKGCLRPVCQLSL